jgi:hypothetical protein
MYTFFFFTHRPAHYTNYHSDSILGVLTQYKLVFIEPRVSTQLPHIISSYKDVINKSYSFDNANSSYKRNGAILVGVCRGKLSEGFSKQ